MPALASGVTERLTTHLTTERSKMEMSGVDVTSQYIRSAELFTAVRTRGFVTWGARGVCTWGTRGVCTWARGAARDL